MQIAFHTGVADPLGFACRLLSKAYRQGARVLVRGPVPWLARLDRELWTFAERSFVPHLRWSADAPAAACAARTPLWLVDGEPPLGQPGCPSIVVGCGADAPSSFDGLTRLIEIVGTDAEQQQAARARWRRYQELGFEITHHAASAAGDRG